MGMWVHKVKLMSAAQKLYDTSRIKAQVDKVLSRKHNRIDVGMVEWSRALLMYSLLWYLRDELWVIYFIIKQRIDK